ncbi:antibiotic biosynthesis monooxygenase [Aerophototrophica crusticola]|uniref:Antibiotic biosynthesis monooxygenase n=1 Tax=Aerophototrophica crusticola TaxID=1709002 RepID=A0A858RAN8_9PROT|nr:antibiotic biosynthesis monooxygenase [Rhodospirillaceae bacterium B3]
MTGKSMAQGVWQLVRVEVRPDLVEAFLEVQGANAAGSRQEPGCERFQVARARGEEQPGGPAIFYFWEEFRDEAAIDAHRQAPHFQAWKRWLETQPDGAVTRKGIRLEPTGI